MPYIRTAAEPRTHRSTEARTAMIQSVHGQMCPGSDRLERALMAIFDVLSERDQHRVLTLLGWESDGTLGVLERRATLRMLTEQERAALATDIDLSRAACEAVQRMFCLVNGLQLADGVSASNYKTKR